MDRFVNQGLTRRGWELLGKNLAGTQLVFTKIQMGQGYLEGGSFLELNALVDPFATLEIEKCRPMDGGSAVVGGKFSYDEWTVGHYYRELGLFAMDPDVGEILYCYGNSDALAEWIPEFIGPAQPKLVQKVIDIVTKIGPASTVIVVLKDGIKLSPEDLEEHNQDVDAHPYIQRQLLYPVHLAEIPWNTPAINSVVYAMEGCVVQREDGETVPGTMYLDPQTQEPAMVRFLTGGDKDGQD